MHGQFRWLLSLEPAGAIRFSLTVQPNEARNRKLSTQLPAQPIRASSEHLSDKRYATGGTRAHCVGLTDGSFRPMGSHIGGAMGGIWTPPIKLFDGFWIAVDGEWLPPARQVHPTSKQQGTPGPAHPFKCDRERPLYWARYGQGCEPYWVQFLL
jgi:hypothetical protein